MIQFQSVIKKFESTKNVVNNVSFTLNKGKIYGLIGPNGAGKTTILRMLLDILKPDEGKITIGSESVNEDLKNRIGYLPEERGLYKQQEVLQTLVYLAQLKGLGEKEAIENAEYYLSRLDMYDFAKRKLGTLSKGQQQKVQFIASILFEPNILILDEPFSGLDPINTKVIKEFIYNFKLSDRIIILSTHQMDTIEEVCDEILLLNKGKLLISGNIMDIKENYSKREYLIKVSDYLSDFSDIESVEKIIDQNDEVKHILLKENVTSNELISEIISKGGLIKHFERHYISLEDLFINLVRKDVIEENNNNS